MPNYIPELEAIEDADSNSTFTIADEPLFREAVEIILAARKVSASYLQRKMRIGYNRAARLVELLEQEGIVGSSRGSRPRDILIENYEF
jgi:S-DNA-T family DNA segregation ATPase FtsK/SpoIIIE